MTDLRAAGNASMPLPVRVTSETLPKWQRQPIATSTTRDHITGRSATGVMIGVNSGGKTQAEEARRQARLNLTETLVRSFATEAASQLLSTVDVEPAVPDPTELPDK